MALSTNTRNRYNTRMHLFWFDPLQGRSAASSSVVMLPRTDGVDADAILVIIADNTKAREEGHEEHEEHTITRQYSGGR